MSRLAFKKWLPHLMVFFVGITWGLTFSIAKMITAQGAHPIGLSFWQAFGSGLILLAISALRGSWPRLSPAFIQHYLVIAITGSIIPGTIYFYAASRVPAGILAITTTLVPLLIYALSLAMKIDRFTTQRAGGILLGFIAILLLVVPESSLPMPGAVAWLMLAFFGTVFYAIESVYVDMKVPKDTDMIALLAGGLLLASLGLLPLAWLLNSWVAISLPLDQTQTLILLMALISAAAYSGYFLLVKNTGAVFASLSGYVMTLAGVFWGVLIFGESHSLWVWVALVLLLLAMALVTPRMAVQAIISPADDA